MKKTRLVSLIALSFFAIVLSACGSSQTAGSWPGITVDESTNTVYVAFNFHVYAVQADNGTEVWRFPVERDSKFSVFSAPQLSADGQLLFGAYNHVFYSIDPENGTANWTFAGASNRYIGSPVAYAANVYAPNSDHKVYALNADGELQWTFSSDQPQWSQPASDGSALYLSSLDHHLYALDAESGGELWNIDLGGTLVSNPVLNEGSIYIGTLNSEVIALNAASGNVSWRFTSEGWVWGTPTFQDGQIYVGDLDGFLYALDAASGRELWRLDTQGPITGSPLVLNEHIYVINEAGKILSVTLEGEITWTKTLEETKLYGSPVAAGDLIIFGHVGSETLLTALDENGDTVWSFIPAN